MVANVQFTIKLVGYILACVLWVLHMWWKPVADNPNRVVGLHWSVLCIILAELVSRLPLDN